MKNDFRNVSTITGFYKLYIILTLTLHYNYILNSGDGKIKREDLQNLVENFRKNIFCLENSRTIAKMIKKVIVL